MHEQRQRFPPCGPRRSAGRENVTDLVLRRFRGHCGSRRIGRRDILHDVYAVLHLPGRRAQFADDLRRGLRRIPFAAEIEAFDAAGGKAAELHVDCESAEEHPPSLIETDEVPPSLLVDDKMRISKDRSSWCANRSVALAGIPPETIEHALGNRSALAWIADQCQVGEDADRGQRSDPSRPDDEGDMFRLVGQVLGVGLAKTKIDESLPAEFSDA